MNKTYWKLVKLRINKEHRLYLIQWQLVHLHIVKHFAKKFLSEVKVSVIKGNASEILTLVDATTTMKGTDGKTDLDVVEIAKRAHEELNTYHRVNR